MKKALLIHPRLARMGGLETRLINYSEYFIQKGWELHIACKNADKSVVPPQAIIHKFPVWFTSMGEKNYRFNKKLTHWKKPVFDFELSLGRSTIQKNILAPADHKGYLKAIGKNQLTKDDILQIKMDQEGYDASENIFACSQMIKNELIELYNVPENKIHVLYPPFNPKTNIIDNDKGAIYKKFNLPEGKIYHLFVSTSHERKGLPLLLEVFKNLQNTNHHLLIIGHKINTGLSNVHSLGFLHNTSLAFSIGNYLLHPALYEPYGQVINEALHYQLPVIVSNRTGASEILQPDFGWVAPNLEVDTWYNMILQLPQTTFNIPDDLMKKKAIDLDSHMQYMLRINRLG